MGRRAGDNGNRLPWVWGAPPAAEADTWSEAAAQRSVVAGPAEVPGTGDPDLRVASRAVTSTARPEALFLWLCQLRRAPYSYDWIDNFGRRSPRVPDPSLVDLEIGQSVMTIFTLDGFERDRSMTLRMKPGMPTRLFGALTVTYEIEPIDQRRCHLRASLRMPPVGRWFGRTRRYLLAWGDLIMMRKQLRVLSGLAERTPEPPAEARRNPA